jgi:hypothetical protein
MTTNMCEDFGFMDNFEPGGKPSLNSNFTPTHFMITARQINVPSALQHGTMYTVSLLPLEVNIWISFAACVVS